MLPRWLADHYCKLYAEFNAGEFSFDDALQLLGVEADKLRIILSNLRKRGFVDVFARRGRKRVYRVADPSEVALLMGKGIDLNQLPETIRPVVRSYLRGLFDRYDKRVVSIVLYGSFGRGKYNKESDIDLLLVIEGYRWDEPLAVEEAERLAIRQWELERSYHKVQPYPLRPEQASYHRPIYLDITIEGKVLYDRGGFISGVLDDVRRRLAELGAERHELPDGSWYWVLKPKVEEGETIEI